MLTKHDAERLDIFEITQEAHRMRAAYTSELFSRFGRWIGSRNRTRTPQAGRMA